MHVYAGLVLTELALKEHLNLLSTPNNKGHDIPSLLLRLSTKVASHHRHVCNQLSAALGNALAALWCQSGKGTPCLAPRSSYPYIRYLRHDSDWPSDHSSSADLATLAVQVARTMNFLQGIGVPL